MWIKKIIEWFKQAKNKSEEDSDGVQWDDDDDGGSEVPLTVSEYIEAWKKLFFDANDKIPTQAEVGDYEIACRFAMETVEEFEDSIIFMAECLHAISEETEDEEVPEYVLQFGKALLVEYITGSLRLIQKQVIEELEEEETEGD